MTQLNKAVVLITGAGGGFGTEFTKQLLQANSRLILRRPRSRYFRRENSHN